MDRDFLVGDDEDDEMNLSNIKEKGRSGKYTEGGRRADGCDLQIITMMIRSTRWKGKGFHNDDLVFVEITVVV